MVLRSFLNHHLNRKYKMKDELKEVKDNLNLISKEIKEIKELMIKLWRAEDMEENNGKFRWPFDEHGNIMENVNLS